MHTASQDILRHKGQRFKQTRIVPGEDQDLGVIFEDGYRTAIPDNIIQNYPEGINSRYLIPPEYRYGIIELSGTHSRDIIKMQTSMVQIGF